MFIFFLIVIYKIQYMEQKYVCVDDLKQKARLILPSGDFNYIESGAEDEITKGRN